MSKWEKTKDKMLFTEKQRPPPKKKGFHKQNQVHDIK